MQFKQLLGILLISVAVIGIFNLIGIVIGAEALKLTILVVVLWVLINFGFSLLAK